MASPTPPVSLSGHCSVIQDSVLYAYSPQAFQSLPLENNGTWSKLIPGVPVSGASCVLQPETSNGAGAALWVVGGKPTEGSTEFSGLQRYSFSTRKWQTISPVVKATQNRLGHAAVFLPDSESILMYAGSQMGASIPTSETFIISIKPPYSVLAQSAKNTPVVSPLLLAWDRDSAITLGGAPSNEKIFRYQLGFGWQQIGPSLPTPLKPSNVEQATLTEGSDNSRILQVFDLSVSPNTVTQLVLQNANGKPAKFRKFIGLSKGTTATKKKRAVTVRNFPDYNSTFAPTGKRTDFAIAKSSDGTIAVSGGGDSRQSVALFNENGNTWINTTEFFGDSVHQRPITVSSTSSSSSAPSATSGAPTIQPASNSNHANTSLILGATLGSILGFIALLIIVLLMLRWRRRKKAQERAQEMAEADDDEKDRMSFVDRGDPFTKETGGPDYPASHHTLSIYDGNEFTQPTHKRSTTRGSDHSTTHLVPKGGDAYEMSPIREQNPSPLPEVSRSGNTLQVPGTGLGVPKRSSGWSRYFSGNDLLASNRNSARSSKAASVNRGSSVSPAAEDELIPDRDDRGPAELPPLDMGQQFQEGRISKQVTGHSGERPISAVPKNEERPRTVSSVFSTVPPSTAASIWSDDGREEQTSWTPGTMSDWTTPRPRDTTTSSIYGPIGDGADGRSSMQAGPRGSALPVRVASGAHVLPTSVQEERGTRAAKATAARAMDAPVMATPQQAVVVEDMSWLNLGAQK